jgi:hypothetical protein
MHWLFGSHVHDPRFGIGDRSPCVVVFRGLVTLLPGPLLPFLGYGFGSFLRYLDAGRALFGFPHLALPGAI